MQSVYVYAISSITPGQSELSSKIIAAAHHADETTVNAASLISESCHSNCSAKVKMKNHQFVSKGTAG